MAKTFLFLSGKGGVGKSTLSAALAVTAAEKGRRVALLDGDIGLRSLDMMLGLQNQVLFDLSDCVKRRCSLDKAMIWHPDFPTLRLMVSGQSAKPKDFKAQDLKKIINTLSKRFDLIFIDGPAGLGKGSRTFLDLADEIILVATPDPVAMRSVERMASMLIEKGKRPCLVINRVDENKVFDGSYDQPLDLAQGLDLPLMGMLQDDTAIYEHLLQGKTAAEMKKETITQSLQEMLERLEGANIPLKRLEETKKTVWQRLIAWLED